MTESTARILKEQGLFRNLSPKKWENPFPNFTLEEKFPKDIIEDVNELDQTETLLKTDIDLKGTKVGYDSETQINTFLTDNIITFYKTLEDTIRLDLDKQNAYTVILIQNGKSTQIIVNGGGDSTIKITQDN